MADINCIAALKALGELSRLRIILQLLNERLPVNEIAQRAGMSAYNTSKHVRILKEAGLLEMQKSGKLRLYTVVPQLREQAAASPNELKLECCTFRFDKLPE